MKKIFTLIAIMLINLLSIAQLPVSTTAGKKQVLIEEFTGNTCGYCPDGHRISDLITSANPGKAFSINIHTGSYSVPASATSSKDFRTTDGNSILSISPMWVTGYPAGAVNRAPLTSGVPQTTGGLAMSRSYWAANANTILTQNSYINVAGQAFLNPNTRVLTINMEVYYTSSAPAGVSSNRISIALVQNNIIAYQLGSSYYPAMIVGSDYRHNHALRDIITTPATGEVMSGPVTSGTKWTKSYTYTVAATIPASGTKAIPLVLSDLELIAFITETDKNVMAVCKVPVQIVTDINEELNSSKINFVNVYPNPIQFNAALTFTLNKKENVSIEIKNILGQTIKITNLGTLSIGEYKHEFNIDNIESGTYFIYIKYGESFFSKKIVVLK